LDIGGSDIEREIKGAEIKSFDYCFTYSNGGTSVQLLWTGQIYEGDGRNSIRQALRSKCPIDRDLKAVAYFSV
jgi:hypothetical protein